MVTLRNKFGESFFGGYGRLSEYNRRAILLANTESNFIWVLWFLLYNCSEDKLHFWKSTCIQQRKANCCLKHKLYRRESIGDSFLQHIPEVKFYNIDLIYGELASAESIQTLLNSFIHSFLPLESQPLHAFLRKVPFGHASFNIQSIVLLSPNDYVNEVTGFLSAALV